MSNHQKFFEVYELINSNHKLFKKHMNHKQLSFAHKQILKAVYELKKGNNSDCLKLLQDLNGDYDVEVLGTINYLFGLAHNNSASFYQAFPYLERALKHFKEVANFHMYQKTLNALVLVYFNLKDLKNLEKLDSLFKQENINQEKIMWGQLNLQLFVNILKKDYTQAINIVNSILSDSNEILAGKIAPYLLYKIEILIELEDYDTAYETLNDYNKTSGFKSKSNYRYLITFLNYLTKDSPVYVYKRDFEENEFLYNQIKLVQALTQNDEDFANKYWKKLAQINNDLYGPNFEYTGPENIFQKSLTKALKSFVPSDKNNTLTKDQVKNVKGATEQLKYILENCSEFLSKDDLILLLWDEQWSPKNDARLRSLISRTQKKYNITIQNNNGKYKKAA